MAVAYIVTSTITCFPTRGVQASSTRRLPSRFFRTRQPRRSPGAHSALQRIHLGKAELGQCRARAAALVAAVTISDQRSAGELGELAGSASKLRQGNMHCVGHVS